MEKTYNDMINSFDIQDADTKNTLVLICKTLLKMNEAINILVAVKVREPYQGCLI